MAVRVREVGPLWEVVLTDAEAAPSAAPSSSLPLARAAGFTLGPLCHIDSLVVHTRRARGAAGARVRPGLAGTGGLAAKAVFALAAARGATRAEVLAIDDGDAADAERRVRVYERAAGFKVVARVGGSSLSDLPHLLVWGGVGARMDADIGAQRDAGGVAVEEEAGERERGRALERVVCFCYSFW
jgi:hypothetical protein